MKQKLRQDAEPEKEDKVQQKKKKADIHILEYSVLEQQQVLWFCHSQHLLSSFFPFDRDICSKKKKQPFEVSQERLLHKFGAFSKGVAEALEREANSLAPELLNRLFSRTEKKLIVK